MYIYIYIYIFIFIFIYTCVYIYMYACIGTYVSPSLKSSQILSYDRGNHLSSTTCLTHVFFRSGEECSKCLVFLDTTKNTYKK